jgi:hypothetical protein
MSLVEVRINQTKTGQHLSLINSYFDQENFQKRDLLVVKLNQFWIVEEHPVERSTWSPKQMTCFFMQM